jgi:ribosomal protein S18 acetylase RimI-like enzyme
MDRDRHPVFQIAHVRLANTLRHLQRYSSYAHGSGLEDEAGALFVAGANAHAHPYVNAAIRIDASADAEDVLRRARTFFERRGREFVLWIAGDRDADLEETAIKHGFVRRAPLQGTAEMLLDEPPPASRLAGVEVSQVTRDGDGPLFQFLVAGAYEPDVPRHLTLNIFADDRVLLVPGAAAFVARADGVPVAAAMVLFDSGAAEVGFVATTHRARGRGFGTLVTTAAARYGFERGAPIVLLQASAMGEPLYRRMGFVELWRYRRYDSPAA